MNLVAYGHKAGLALSGLGTAAMLALFPCLAMAQDGGNAVEGAAQETGSAVAPSAAEMSAYVPMVPVEGKGMPTPGGIGFQQIYSPTGEYALWMHNGILMPVITVITLFVLALLLWVVVRYNRRANPEPSRTTHNTLIEVVWTLVPVAILVLIAIPSITLLARQYESPPEDAITLKATGVQWYWEYEFPDHGVTFLSKMLNEPGKPVVNPGVREVGSEPWDGPAKLEVDNRVVVPVGVPLRIQTTATDVIHSFAIPSLWFKLDAVPGRLNEKKLLIKEPGVYYGQCSELCGVKHAYMPIAIEAVPMDQWRAWIRAQGGSFPDEQAPAATPTPEASVQPETAAEPAV